MVERDRGGIPEQTGSKETYFDTKRFGGVYGRFLIAGFAEKSEVDLIINPVKSLVVDPNQIDVNKPRQYDAITHKLSVSERTAAWQGIDFNQAYQSWRTQFKSSIHSATDETKAAVIKAITSVDPKDITDEDIDKLYDNFCNGKSETTKFVESVLKGFKKRDEKIDSTKIAEASNQIKWFAGNLFGKETAGDVIKIIDLETGMTNKPKTTIKRLFSDPNRINKLTNEEKTILAHLGNGVFDYEDTKEDEESQNRAGYASARPKSTIIKPTTVWEATTGKPDHVTPAKQQPIIRKGDEDKEDILPAPILTNSGEDQDEVASPSAKQKTEANKKPPKASVKPTEVKPQPQPTKKPEASKPRRPRTTKRTLKPHTTPVDANSVTASNTLRVEQDEKMEIPKAAETIEAINNEGNIVAEIQSGNEGIIHKIPVLRPAKQPWELIWEDEEKNRQAAFTRVEASLATTDQRMQCLSLRKKLSQTIGKDSEIAQDIALIAGGIRSRKRKLIGRYEDFRNERIIARRPKDFKKDNPFTTDPNSLDFDDPEIVRIRNLHKKDLEKDGLIQKIVDRYNARGVVLEDDKIRMDKNISYFVSIEPNMDFTVTFTQDYFARGGVKIKSAHDKILVARLTTDRTGLKKWEREKDLLSRRDYKRLYNLAYELMEIKKFDLPNLDTQYLGLNK